MLTAGRYFDIMYLWLATVLLESSFLNRGFRIAKDGDSQFQEVVNYGFNTLHSTDLHFLDFEITLQTCGGLNEQILHSN